ncbi:hypothetical protein FUA23_02165 [Neolewinella aurantiaca]|uniref:Uncharacterized protein n=1 Tax=Neolewinella aurantiaca TaxID=2602767 RepID=A0A5C7FYA8_9BACT|nr:hypothetical protein [Neolewinella aurantiaca]TXF91523.1 hypothetical protein FUA23_02165 [Neolewinella aurantiaca]
MQSVDKLGVVILVLLFWAGTQVQCAGQELRTNSAGEKIIVYPDGSARYFNDLTLIDEQQKDSAGAAYPVVKVVIEPLSGGVDPTIADLKAIAERKLQLAREAETLARARATAALNNRVALERDLEAARLAGRAEEVAALQRRLQLTRQVEADALNERTAAEQRAASANVVVAEGRYVDAYNEARRKEREGPAAPKPANRTEKDLKMLFPAAPVFSGFGEAAGRIPVSEPPPCTNNLPAQRMGGPRPVTYPTLFFTHTDENLRPFLDGKEYLRATAWTSRDDRGDRYLHVRYTFANPNVLTSYGYLAQNSSLSLHLLNGRHLSLQAAREAVGIIDHGRREVNYDVTYLLPRGAAAELRNQALDYVRVFWSSGFEQYEVYQVEVLRQLMECL